MVPTHRPVLREERARRDRHCQSTPRVEATHPDCGIFPHAERDQEVGQRVCSTVSKRTDVQRHRQSGVHESKIRSLLSSETTHPTLHQWILETFAPGQTPTPGLGSSNQSTTSSSTMSTQHNGDKIGTLVMSTHKEVKMVSCTVCRKAKGRAKVEVSTASATTVESQVIRPICKRWKSKRKGKEGRQQRLE